MNNSKIQPKIMKNGLGDADYRKWEDIKSYIFPCLVPAGWNNLEPKMNGELASSDFLDLSIYYYIRLEEDYEKVFQKIAWVNNTTRKEWGVSIQRLEEQARKNIRREGYSIRSMEELLQIAFADKTASEMSAGISLYVLTNQRAFFGAV